MLVRLLEYLYCLWNLNWIFSTFEYSGVTFCGVRHCRVRIFSHCSLQSYYTAGQLFDRHFAASIDILAWQSLAGFPQLFWYILLKDLELFKSFSHSIPSIVKTDSSVHSVFVFAPVCSETLARMEAVLCHPHTEESEWIIAKSQRSKHWSWIQKRERKEERWCLIYELFNMVDIGKAQTQKHMEQQDRKVFKGYCIQEIENDTFPMNLLHRM